MSSFALGILSALVAPFLMVLGFIIWDNHWTGSAFALNMYKCTIAGIGFGLVSLLYCYNQSDNDQNNIFTLEKVGYLMLSSTIGILIGDWTWLEGMRLLGARKVIVMDSLKPFLGAFLGKVFLNESLHIAAFGGLVLTVLGVVLVGFEIEDTIEEDGLSSSTRETDIIPSLSPPQNASFESEEDGYDNATKLPVEAKAAAETDSLLSTNNKKVITVRSDSYAEQRKNRKQSVSEMLYGMTMSISNVILHTFGALLTKKYGVGMTTWEINFIRFGFAGACMTMLSFAIRVVVAVTKEAGAVVVGSSSQQQQQQQQQESEDEEPRCSKKDEAWYMLPRSQLLSSWVRVLLGIACVSFMCPALTNYAMFQISLALLLTLESIGPLYSLPLSYLLQEEIPTYKACVGAALAVTGIVILSFKGMTDE